MKLFFLTGVSLVLVTVGFFIGHYWFHASVPCEATDSAPDKNGGLPEEEFHRARVLIVLVDGADVYVGSTRAPQDGLEDYIAHEMTLNRTKWFTVCGSDIARFGDVVRLVDRLKKKRLRFATVITRPAPPGTRLAAVDIEAW